MTSPFDVPNVHKSDDDLGMKDRLRDRAELGSDCSVQVRAG